MFSFCKKINGDLKNWDVSNVTNMTCMFSECNEFHQDLSNWDVSNVTTMEGIFKDCEKMNRFKFKTDLVKETILVDKKEKCIICLEEKETYNKLCNKEKENDHYYCNDCLKQSDCKRCLICKTKPYWVKYQMNTE